MQFNSIVIVECSVSSCVEGTALSFSRNLCHISYMHYTLAILDEIERLITSKSKGVLNSAAVSEISECTETTPSTHNSENEYLVEKILDHRKKDNGTIEYKIKWHGFSNEFDTWEPIENLNCPELLQEYEETLVKGRKPKRCRSCNNIECKGRGGIKYCQFKDDLDGLD